MNPIRFTRRAAWLSLVGSAILLPFTPSTIEAKPKFVPIGPSDANTRSYANDVSHDGQYVVGETWTVSGPGPGHVFRWHNGVLEYLPHLPNDTSQLAYSGGISADGQTIAGSSATESGVEAFIWNPIDGITTLPGMPAGLDYVWAYRVSADGSVVIGSHHSGGIQEAFRWTLADGVEGLGDLLGGVFNSSEGGVSADGSIVVGQGHSSLGTEAFRWTEATGMVGLGHLPGGAFVSSYANAISGDGTTIVGASSSANGREAFLWTQSGGMIGLGDLPGGSFTSDAYGVSDGGTRVAGSSATDNGHEAMLWTPQDGMRKLQAVLIDDYGLGAELAGWSLGGIAAMSPDGTWVVGTGKNAKGHTQGWLAHFEQPLPPVAEFRVLHSFEYGSGHGFNGQGFFPSTPVVYATDGKLYGSTARGGANFNGTLFSLSPDGSGFATTLDFGFAVYPYNSLFQGIDGRLYGYTVYGGADNVGTVYSVSLNGSDFRVLRSMDGNDYWGADPQWIMQASDTRLYGLSYTFQDFTGNLFSMNADGTNFGFVHFYGAWGTLVETPDGRLFGSNGLGVFAYHRSTNTFEQIHTMDIAMDSEGLSLASDGKLYGTTQYFANMGGGTVFSIDPGDSSFKVLHSFADGYAGANPVQGVIEGIDGKLYGLTRSGGAHGKGVFYRIDRDGKNFRIIRHFDPASGDPEGFFVGLTRGSDGAIYGTSLAGGAAGYGTVFSVVSNSTAQTGTNVVIEPEAVDENGDPVDNAPAITLAFDQVNTTGATMVTVTDTAPPLPSGLKLGDPPIYLDITTSATFDGMIQVCIDYSNMTFAGDPADLRLAHYENGSWVDITVLPVDTANHTICGLTSSFSPFAIVETDDPVELLAALVDTVAALNASHGIINSLDSKLGSANDALTDAKTNNDGSAINILMSAFINAVEAQSGKQIFVSEADDLIARANAIVGVLNFSIHK